MRSALSTVSTGISTLIASTSVLSVTRPWVSLPATPSSPSSSAAGSVCVPGRDGIPSSWLGHLMCGDYLTHPLAHVPHAAGQLAALWPLLAAVALFVACLRTGWALCRHASWRAAATSAVWWEIVPPVTATPAATLALWRLLATLLRTPRRLAVRPCRLVWEVVTTPDGMRCGLWVPAGVNPTAVLRALQRAWPGVRAEQTDPPYLPHLPGSWPLVGVSLRSRQADWLPLVDEADPVAAKRFASSPEADRIAAVYDGLAAAGRTGGGLLQVHVGRAPGHRVAVLRRATVNPHRARRPRGTARVAVVALETLRAALSAVIDLVVPGPAASGPRAAVPLDLATVDQARQARVKYATAPHLIVAVRLFATGPTAGAARAAVADAGSGYSLLSPHWQRRRLRRSAAASWWRWVPEARMQVATVAETAALAGLPAEPSTYGLPAAGARRLPARRDVFTSPDDQRSDGPRDDQRAVGLNDGDDGDDPTHPDQHDQNPDGRHHNGQHPNDGDDSPTAWTAP